MSILAVNSKGQKQTFSDLAWKLLGKNTGDWKEVANQSISNTVTRPNMGPQTISNTAGKSKEEIEEAARVAAFDKKFNSGTDNSNEEDSEEEGKKTKTDTGKEEFNKALEGISNSVIKEFFDKQDPKVTYSNKKQDAGMIKPLLADYLKYDIVALQKAFM